MEGSSITFRNCTIDKPTGNLLTNSTGTNWKLNLIFENTPLSDNLRILNDTQKQCVNLIIKQRGIIPLYFYKKGGEEMGKFHNKKTIVDGIKFDSEMESHYYI